MKLHHIFPTLRVVASDNGNNDMTPNDFIFTMEYMFGEIEENDDTPSIRVNLLMDLFRTIMSLVGTASVQVVACALVMMNPSATIEEKLDVIYKGLPSFSTHDRSQPFPNPSELFMFAQALQAIIIMGYNDYQQSFVNDPASKREIAEVLQSECEVIFSQYIRTGSNSNTPTRTTSTKSPATATTPPTKPNGLVEWYNQHMNDPSSVLHTLLDAIAYACEDVCENDESDPWQDTFSINHPSTGETVLEIVPDDIRSVLRLVSLLQLENLTASELHAFILEKFPDQPTSLSYPQFFTRMISRMKSLPVSNGNSEARDNDLFVVTAYLSNVYNFISGNERESVAVRDLVTTLSYLCHGERFLCCFSSFKMGYTDYFLRSVNIFVY